jgi:hypothetical protein
MANAYASGVIDRAPAEVWECLRDFASISNWLEGVDASELDGPNATPGTVRRLKLGDGAVLLERLVSISDPAREFSYEFASDNPFGVSGYRATMRVTPVTDSGGSFVEWYAAFDAPLDQVEGTVATFQDDVFGSGIADLRSHLTLRSGGERANG